MVQVLVKNKNGHLFGPIAMIVSMKCEIFGLEPSIT
jgi:hypothetical protein